MVEPEEEDAKTEETPVISLYAMEGVQGTDQQTMRLVGNSSKRPLHLLVDTGSTYNVLDSRLVKLLEANLSLYYQ